MVEEYMIRCDGHLDIVWSEWFNDLDMIHLDDGTTLLWGPLLDQSALYGVLSQLRDLSLPLLFAIRVNPSDAAYQSLHEYCVACCQQETE